MTYFFINSLRKFIIRFFACLSFFYALHAHADIFSLLPNGVYENYFTLNTAADYNTNAALIAGAEVGVWQYSVIPKYKVSNFDDVNEWFADVSLRVIRSSNKSIIIDREDPIFNFGLNRQLWIGSLNVNAHYEEASSRTTEFNESGIVFNDITRVNRSINTSWQYQLTEKLGTSIGVNLSDSKFKGGGTNLIGNKNIGIINGFNYAINEKLIAVVQLAVTKFIPENNQQAAIFGQSESVNRNLNAGLDWQYSENSFYGFRVGENRITGANAGTGWNGSANYRYMTERSSINFDASRSVNPSGLGALLESDRLSAAWNYALTDRSGFGLNYAINKNRGINATESLQYGANYNYELSERWRLGVNGTFREIEDPLNQTNAKSIGLTFTYQHPVF